MRICSKEGCSKRHYSLGLCRSHYWSFNYYRKCGYEKKSWPKTCSVDGCKKESLIKGLCNAHYLKKKRLGSPTAPQKRNSSGTGHTTPGGYFKLRGKMEHRRVMEEILNRDLLPEENIHHKNGVRNDNRPKNLELWSKSQPAGQRVKDKVKWAKEILMLYEPVALSR